MNRRNIVLLLAGMMAAASARAEIITVSPWHTGGGNGAYTDAFGAFYNVPNVVCQHRTKGAFGAGPDTSQLVIQSLGFSDLQGVSYTSEPVGNVHIQPLPGWTGGVSFYGFDLGVWQTPPLQRDVEYEIWNGDFSAKLANGTVTVGALRTTVNLALFSPNGFQVQFESEGVVAIDNYRVEGNDSAAPKPFITVSGNGNGIAYGDTTPQLSDHTDFGSGAGSRVFTITNTGALALNLTGTAPDLVTLSGSGDFSITAQPATPLAAHGGSTSFSVAFHPSTPGVKTATVSIASDDTSRTPFTFMVSGYTAGFSDGSLDPAFGSSGKVISPISGTANEYGNAVAVQPDGKIVVAGLSSASIAQFAVARYSAEGVPDAGFGNGGFVLLDIGPSMDECKAVCLQPDGKILLAGYTWNGSNYDFVVARLTPEGGMDQTFGSAGLVITPVGAADDFANAMVLQADGKILVAGTSAQDFAVVRYTPAGALDSSFGSGGKFISTISGGSVDNARAMALQSDGKIVLAGGSMPVGGNFGFAAMRCTSAGAPDPGFGTGGVVYAALRTGIDVAQAVVVQQDGKILLGGYSNNAPTDEDFILMRYSSEGVPDAGFGSGGVVITALGPSSDLGNAIGLQADGKIILAGSTHDYTTSDVAMVRYTTSGALDPTFGTNGKVVSNLASGQNDVATAMALLPTGRIVLAGYAYSPVTGIDFAVAVYGVPSPDIAVSQGTSIPDGGSASIGATVPGQATTPVTFTISNPGSADLSSLAISTSGPDAADFTIGNLSATSIPTGAGTATFSVTFSPLTPGTKTATIQIASNVGGAKNPFDITLTGQSLSHALDSDGDGLNDASEFRMSALGFLWQTPQNALVSAYYQAASSAGLFTAEQIQAQHPGAALIRQDADSGTFTLTLGVEKSTTLLPDSFSHFPITPLQVGSADGGILFTFPDDDPRAFYRIKSESSPTPPP